MNRHLLSTTPSSPPARSSPAGPKLPCRVRLADGRVFDGELAPERHRAIQLGILHADSDGLVELTPGTRHPDGTLAVDRRGRAEHYLPGGAGRHPEWLPDLLAHAERIIAGEYARPHTDAPREEVFVGVTARTCPRGSKDAVNASGFLWIDVDRPDRLDALWSFLAERPCHLLIESGGSGGAHAYWKLGQPLDAVRQDRAGGLQPIEHANARIVHALGVDATGRPDVADPQCADRSRVMRLAGTINHKRGRWARIISADLALAPYALDELVGDLPEPALMTSRATRHDGDTRDPYKRITPAQYFARLAGITVRGGELVRCPVPGHDDTHPSCSVGRDPSEGWCCHAASCGARGAIYDLASVLIGGPWGSTLRGEHFARARRAVAAAFGETTTAVPARTEPKPSDREAAACTHAAEVAAATETRWRVRVREDIDPRIAGHGGSAYLSPPQPRADALTLAGLLLGQQIEAADAGECWTHPVAGGRRTVAVERAGTSDPAER